MNLDRVVALVTITQETISLDIVKKTNNPHKCSYVKVLSEIKYALE